MSSGVSSRFVWGVVCAALVGGTGCRRTPPAPAPDQHGIDLAGMDTSVAPGDDFNAYANGGWAKATAIPPDKSSYGPWAVLTDLTRQRTVSLIQDIAKAGTAATGDDR